MNIFENIKMAIESIKANKLRSFLTMLGIIIGISSVITIISLGQGGKNAITGQFEKIGANTVQITVNASKAKTGDYFDQKDTDLIKQNIDSVKYITPYVQKQGIAISEKKSKRAFIKGENPDYAQISSVDMAEGRYFNEIEYLEGKPVIVVDEATAKAMFGTTDVVGKSLNIGSQETPQRAKIIGVSKSMASLFGGDNDNMPAFIDAPITFVQKLYPSQFQIDTLYEVADKKDNVDSMASATRSLLESRHNNRGEEVYKLENLLKQLDQINKVLGIFTAFISAVAAISLLVGGIGVMNIMLVSVTERTREIGIRKAIGATTKVILFQFLTESVIISLIGGIIGMLVGIIGSQLIGLATNIVPAVSITAIAGTILFSSAVGIFFGIYPARKAAKLDPIEALRYE